jgi:hypothetical protein
VTLSVSDRSRLGDGTVLFNRGGTVPPLAAGEAPAAPASAAPFVTSPGTAGVSVLTGVVNNIPLPLSFLPLSTSIAFRVPQQTFGDTTGVLPVTQSIPAISGIAPPAFGRLAFEEGGNGLDAATPGSFTASAGSIYVIDYYLSTSTTNPVPAGTQAIVLRNYATVGAGKNYQHQFSIGGTTATSAGSAPRVYSTIFGGDAGNVQVGTDFLAFFGRFITATPGLPAQVYTVHRIVATEYPMMP